MSACSICCGMKPSRNAARSSAVNSCAFGTGYSGGGAGLVTATAAFVSTGFGACEKIAAPPKTAAPPSHKSHARIDSFTVKASLFCLLSQNEQPRPRPTSEAREHVKHLLHSLSGE